MAHSLQNSNEGNEDSDSNSSMFQQIQMATSTTQPVHPHAKQNPLDVESNAIPVSQPSYKHAASFSAKLSDEHLNIPGNDDKTDRKWIKILLVICTLYSVIGVTYLLFISHFTNMANDTKCDCKSLTSQYGTFPPSYIPSLTSSPSKHPSNISLEPPSMQPTKQPSQNPTNDPSESPTLRPTLQPTIDEHFIGDYKISAKNSSHGNWLLCDGSFVNAGNYPQLFGMIGYTFGILENDAAFFKLPNVSDHVVGINGNLNVIGTVVGKEEITLAEDNLPPHWHYILNNGECDADPSSSTHYYLARSCSDSTYINTNFWYSLHPNNNIPNKYRSGSVGNGKAVNIMQPTVFVGNLFIYAG